MIENLYYAKNITKVQVPIAEFSILYVLNNCDNIKIVHVNAHKLTTAL